MAVQVEIKHDLDDLSRQLGLLADERLQAAVRALNRTLTTVRAEGARAMAGEYPGLKIAALKKQMRFKRASKGDPAASVTFSNRRFRLFGNWSASQTPRGVRVGRKPWRIETGDGREIPAEALRQAFIQRARTNGTANVWIRVGKERYPITVLVAPSLAAAFVQRKIGDGLAKKGRERFAVTFQQEAKFRLSKRG